MFIAFGTKAKQMLGASTSCHPHLSVHCLQSFVRRKPLSSQPARVRSVHRPPVNRVTSSLTQQGNSLMKKSLDRGLLLHSWPRVPPLLALESVERVVPILLDVATDAPPPSPGSHSPVPPAHTPAPNLRGIGHLYKKMVACSVAVCSVVS
ncbi:hypothetical protein BaRGS_00038618 [Batillaria attramentaria]|uniref:Uncharacterized protein n=1 Tax=Batillaria attramentaria TaxID=370345 RepID=A0ABD0J5K4_9CAEN